MSECSLVNVDVIANAVMRAVAATGAVTEAKIPAAIEIMRAELKAFFLGEEYAAERACLMAGTVSQQTVLASVVASCVLKIKSSG